MALSVPIIGSIVTSIMQGLDPLFTSKEEKLAAELELTKTLQQPHILQAVANIEGAKHRSVFVAGWRPAIGWVCAVGLGYALIIRDMALFIGVMCGLDLSALPEPDVGTLLTMSGNLLGLGALRTFEKVNGVDTKQVGSH